MKSASFFGRTRWWRFRGWPVLVTSQIHFRFSGFDLFTVQAVRSNARLSEKSPALREDLGWLAKDPHGSWDPLPPSQKDPKGIAFMLHAAS